MKKILILAVFAAAALTGVYTVITLYDSNMKIGRLFQTPVVRPHEKPLLIMDSNVIASHQSETLTKETLKQPAPLLRTLKSTEEMILAKGKKEYNAFCSHCHGLKLDGLGTVGQSFNPLPMNLTGDKAARLSDREIFNVISYGTEKTPALASSMSRESRMAVIQYIRSKQKTVK